MTTPIVFFQTIYLLQNRTGFSFFSELKNSFPSISLEIPHIMNTKARQLLILILSDCYFAITSLPFTCEHI